MAIGLAPTVSNTSPMHGCPAAANSQWMSGEELQREAWGCPEDAPGQGCVSIEPRDLTLGTHHTCGL